MWQRQRARRRRAEVEQGEQRELERTAPQFAHCIGSARHLYTRSLQRILGRLFRDGLMSKSEEIGTLSSPGDKEWILALVAAYDKDDSAGYQWPLDEYIRKIEEQLKSRFVNTLTVVYNQTRNASN